MHSLSFGEYKQIKSSKSNSSFKFGESKFVKKLKKVKIPVIIAGAQATVTTDVVEYDIPLLLSKEAMKKAKTQIDFQEDKINIFGKKLKYISLQLVIIVLNSKVNSVMKMYLSQMYFFAVMYKI